MGWFSRKKVPTNETLGRGFVLQVDEPTFMPLAHEMGPFRIMHREGRLDPAQNTTATVFGYDTLGLMPMFPINHFNMVQQPIRPAQPGMQVWVNPGAFIYELPQPNGQIFLQPLFDPNAPDNG